ncbi:MAG TPA: hypothetical protein PLF40_19945 [Kofleriaceae bacterium]|nr:hypothetical protein [Kofleriaceae bacterium]
MSTPFRESGIVQELTCPRCKKKTLPGLDVAPCPAGCGTLVSAFAATEVFSAKELRVDAATRWWRRREPCPMCSDAMTLRGSDPGYFQGCDGHVFWVDADTIAHTGLANGVDEGKLQRKRESSAVLEQEQQARVAHETQRMNAKREKEEREARLQRVSPPAAMDPSEFPTLSTGESLALAASIGVVATPILRSQFDAMHRRQRELEQRVAALESALAAIRATLAARD